MKKASIITMTALAVSAANTTYAEEQLDTLVVTASGFEQDTTEAPASISVVTAEEIEKGAYRNIGEVLENIPSVKLTRSGGGTNLGMRGLSGDYTMIMVDGRTQSSREARSGIAEGYEQEWLPPLSMVERIEVVQGPMSTLYGSSAMGGAINIITKKHPSNWRGNLHSEIIVSEGSNFNDTQKSSLYLGGPIIEDTLSVQFGAEFLDQEEDNIDGGYPEKEIDTYFAKFDLSINENHEIGLDISKASQERTRTAGVTDENDSLQENKKESIAITHSGRYGDLTENSFIQQEVTNNTTDDSEITNTQFDTKWIVPTDNHTFTVGGSYIDAELKDNSNLADSGLTKLSSDQISLFAEDEWYLFDDFALVTGLRADKNENFDNHLSPKVYGVWNVTDTWTLKGGVSTGYKAPTLRRLSDDWAIGSNRAVTYGNSELKPESSVSSELSATYSGTSFVTTVAIYKTDFDDKLDRMNCRDTTICSSSAGSRDRIWVNIDKVETKGVELSTKYQLTHTLSTSLNYTYSDSEVKSDNERRDGVPLLDSPKHLASLSVNWTATDKLNLWTDYTYYGKSNEEDDPTPSYKLIDVGANYKFNKNLKLSLGINNTLDEEFTDEEYGYVDHGREYWAAVDASF
ncbi:TonB-dependent receptor domain-containing protein [Marinomonas balearica]|uniref:Outer membrane receptor for ferrienterochelin and colicins n=1 Tax=Marinomonas balearica TaxID=491947 RepID=A0A4R6MJR2_9GAMM|nr:TonB-dependent receptor [Marinomonas balearica]TDP00500.1 outer membrane receptor for ferrienterochelin and colicins [Marinomonas balearica]